MKLIKNETFCIFKEAFYLLAESSKTSVFLLLCSFIFFTKMDNLLLLVFGFIMLIMTMMYIVIKFFDSIEKILDIKKRPYAFICFILLLLFYIGLFSSIILIAFYEVLPLLELITKQK